MHEAGFLLLFDELLELAPGTVAATDVLENLEGWNSLAVIGLMALVDERLGIGLQARQLAACTTVADIISLVGDRVTVATNR